MSSPISSKARAHLKALAHDLRPVVQIGQQGLTPSLQEAVETALFTHELIKVKVGQAYEGDRKALADQVAAASGAVPVQLIGRVIVLYRRRGKELRGRPRIELPR